MSTTIQVLMNTTFNWMVDYAYAKEFVKATGYLPIQILPIHILSHICFCIFSVCIFVMSLSQ